MVRKWDQNSCTEPHACPMRATTKSHCSMNAISTSLRSGYPGRGCTERPQHGFILFSFSNWSTVGFLCGGTNEMRARQVIGALKHRGGVPRCYNAVLEGISVVLRII